MPPRPAAPAAPAAPPRPGARRAGRTRGACCVPPRRPCLLRQRRRPCPPRRRARWGRRPFPLFRSGLRRPSCRCHRRAAAHAAGARAGTAADAAGSGDTAARRSRISRPSSPTAEAGPHRGDGEQQRGSPPHPPLMSGYALMWWSETEAQRRPAPQDVHTCSMAVSPPGRRAFTPRRYLWGRGDVARLDAGGDEAAGAAAASPQPRRRGGAGAALSGGRAARGASGAVGAHVGVGAALAPAVARSPPRRGAAARGAVRRAAARAGR